MAGIFIFIVLPLVLIGLSFWIKPLVGKDLRTGDPFGGSLSARGMFGGHGLEPDETEKVPEETEPVKFDLEGLQPRSNMDSG